jgi:hypothetical protein
MAVDPRNLYKINNLSPLSKTDELLTTLAVFLQSVNEGLATTACADTARLDEIEENVKDMINKGRELGFEVAADRLEYWFNGNGGKYPFDVNWLRSIYDISLGESKNLERFVTGDGKKEKSLLYIASQLEDGETAPPHIDFWEYERKVPSSFDFGLAVGAFELISKCHLSISRAGETIRISGEVKHHFKDRYDFNPGGSFIIPGYTKYGVRVIVRNDELNLLRDCRNAKDFDQDTCWRQTIDTTVRFPPERFLLNVVETESSDCTDCQIVVEE